ncbi:serine-protein kinase ATM, partial [Tremellales sp. Uapishka_1]
MLGSSVADLDSAVKSYCSEKVKERASGLEAIRMIFSSQKNLSIFQDKASVNGGQGWVAFFKCLFEVVVREKKAVKKKTDELRRKDETPAKAGTSAVDKRLSDAISLVRWMTELSVRLLSRKPFVCLFVHMTQLLVDKDELFLPAALDYSKALRCLITYSPHLDNLDPSKWKWLMGICWAVVLGDEIKSEHEWEDDGELEADADLAKIAAFQAHPYRSTITQTTTELVSLIPILLSSSSAPLIPACKQKGDVSPPAISVGYSILLKIHRFLLQYQTETALPPIVLSLNIVLAELELNSRSDFQRGGMMLLPQLARLWTARNKATREQVLIAFRILLPSLARQEVLQNDTERVISDAMERVFEVLGKDSTISGSGGIKPLDMGAMRLQMVQSASDTAAFQTGVLSAGFDFTHEQALTWAVLELYANCCFHLLSIPDSSVALRTTQGPATKRRKIQNSLSTLLASISHGPLNSRLLALQVLLFLVDKHVLASEMLDECRKAVIDQLDDDNADIQSWAFVILAALAGAAPVAVDEPESFLAIASPSHHLNTKIGEQGDWEKVWTHAVRKISAASLCRAASHAADVLLKWGKIPASRSVKDIQSLLQSVHIQGPSYPFDSVCAFLDTALKVCRGDVRLYSMGLEDKVVEWLEKWTLVETMSRKNKMDPSTPADILALINQICGFPPVHLDRPTLLELLPDCAIADRMLEEYRTQPIRNFLLHAALDLDQMHPHAGPSKVDLVEADTLKRLDGRPLQISTLFINILMYLVQEWESLETVSQPAEKTRKTIDVIVLVLAFQGSLEINAIRPDLVPLQLCAKLLNLIQPVLASPSFSIPGQHLIWRGFGPLVDGRLRNTVIWPMLLKPNRQSGIRQDLLPPKHYDSEIEGESEIATSLQVVIWRMRIIQDALQGVLNTCTLLIENTMITSVNVPGTQALPSFYDGDDNFGEVRTAESDAMPVSKEAMECQRTSRSYLQSLVYLRLKGNILVSPFLRPIKDERLLNAFLSADGQRCIQLGSVICQAIMSGTLRLYGEAVEAIMETLEEMFKTYAYSRDDGLTTLIIDFMECSLPLWLHTNDETTTRMIYMARFLVQKFTKGQAPSWKVRLRLLAFLDYYLDRDPTFATWQPVEDEDMDEEESRWGPQLFIIDSIVSDPDLRVRFRAASSAARLAYFSHEGQHLDLYLKISGLQAGIATEWDVFLSHVLWKLNVCIVSARLQAMTIFHLYEIYEIAPSYIHFLQSGLEAIARRLGLTSFKSLYLAYATPIVVSQLRGHQRFMEFPPRLYGFITRKSWAAACLSAVGAALLASNEIDKFESLCDAAGDQVAPAITRYFPSAAAIAYAGIRGGPNAENSITPESAIREVLGKLKFPTKHKSIEDVVRKHLPAIISHLFDVMDLSNSDAQVVVLLDGLQGTRHQYCGQVYSLLVNADMKAADIDDFPPVVGATTDAPALLRALEHLETLEPFESSSMVFDALLRLFNRIHDTPLVNEQRRFLRCIALLVSLYHVTDFTNADILQLFLRTTLSLMTQVDIGVLAFPMLQWGFSQISLVKSEMIHLVSLFVQLGTIRDALGSVPASRELANEFESWIVASVPHWAKSGGLQVKLQMAIALWPTSLSSKFIDLSTPLFTDLSLLAQDRHIGSSMTLCQRLSDSLSSGDALSITTFRESTFWMIKNKMSSDEWNEQGAMAWMDLLEQLDGRIHAPSLEALRELEAGSGYRDLTTKLAKEPDNLLKAIFIRKIVDFTTGDDYQLRKVAYAVLQATRKRIEILLERNVLPIAIASEIRILIATTPPLPRIQPINLDVLTANAWVRKSRACTDWALSLSTLLSQAISPFDDFYAALEPVLAASGTAVVDFLPYLVQAVLTIVKRADVGAAMSGHFTLVLNWPSVSTQTIETILHIVLHLRHFRPIDASKSWLDIDPLLLSEAAIKCGAYATSLLFLEMANDASEDALDMFDSRVQVIMYEIYSNVGDPDGFYGIRTSNARDTLLRRLDHEGQYWRAFGFNGATYESGKATSSSALIPVLRNLHQIGFDQIASSVLKSARAHQTFDSSDPLFFELAWRTGDWDLPVSSETSHTPSTLFYSALRAVHRERDTAEARAVVISAVKSGMSLLEELGMERITQIEESATNLLCLRDVVLWLSEATQRALESGKFDDESVTRFTSLEKPFDFRTAERLTATRLSLINAARARENKKLIGDLGSSHSEGLAAMQRACELQLGGLARKAGNLQAAVNAITAVQQLESGGLPSFLAQDEFSHVLWSQKEHSLAIAHWTSLAKLKAAHEIKDTFDEAYRLAYAHRITPSELAQLFHEYATFADRHYAVISKSSELERLRTYHSRKTVELKVLEASLRPSSGRQSSSRSAYSERQKEADEDAQAIQKLETERMTYLSTSLKMYAAALAFSDNHNDSITRLCSLWLEHDTDSALNKDFAVHLAKIPSHKFIFLGPQLAARLYQPTNPTDFSTSLNQLVERLAREHPYHILYQIITLADGVSKSRRISVEPSAAEGRGPAAANILMRMETDQHLPLVAKASKYMKRFAEASVAWCYNPEKSAKSTGTLPTDAALAKISRTGWPIPIATVPPPIDLTCRYADIVYLRGYAMKYKVAGGVHRPTILDCVDSLGQHHTQLFKGEDEVRQDAVMEQVFAMTNDLLMRDRKASARELRFRTYVVVPLAQKSGIIEFVTNTLPIGDYLKAAHKRDKVKTLQSDTAKKPELVSSFIEMMNDFPPVMRHFFTEKHRDPMAWFAMRLKYARSVAVTSMVGYMVGLGDRHCSNILIDQVTGELVQIDFGIVFEEGAKLRVPEKVPFRLTSDIVDGLGINGVEGTFRRCSEHTLRVLRESSELILTVLEVFKHDPLYAWTGDPEKLQRAQGGGRVDNQLNATVQEKADRVLSRIRAKLGHDLSVEYTVNQLIQEARDPESLATIYYGWQAWL